MRKTFFFLVVVGGLSSLPSLFPNPSYAEIYNGLYAPAGREGDDWDCQSVGQDKGAIEITESNIIGPDISCELAPTSYPNQTNFPLSEYNGVMLDVTCDHAPRKAAVTMARWQSYDTQGLYIVGSIDPQNPNRTYHQLRQCNSNSEIPMTDNNFREVLVGEPNQYWFTPYPLGENLTELIFQSQSVLRQINRLMWEESRSSTREIDDLLRSLPENSQLQVSGRINNDIINRELSEAVSFDQRGGYILGDNTAASIRNVLDALNGQYSVIVTENGDFEGLICYVEQETARLEMIPAVSETYMLYGIPGVVNTNSSSIYGQPLEQPTPLCTAVYASSINEPVMRDYTGYNHYTTFKVYIDTNLNFNEVYPGDLLFLNGTLRQINQDGVVIEFSEARIVGEEIISPHHYNNEPTFK